MPRLFRWKHLRPMHTRIRQVPPTQQSALHPLHLWRMQSSNALWLISQTNTYNSHQRISLTELFSEIDRVLLFGKDMDLQKSLSSLGDKVHFFEDMEDATTDSVTYPLILAAICRPLGMTEWLFASDGDAELLIPKLVSRGMRVVLVQGIGQQIFARKTRGMCSGMWRLRCRLEFSTHKTGDTRRKGRGGERCSHHETKLGRICFVGRSRLETD